MNERLVKAAQATAGVGPRKQWTGTVATALLSLIVCGGLAVLLVGHSQHTAPTAAQPQPQPQPQPSSPSSTRAVPRRHGAGCSLPAVTATVSDVQTSPPAITGWHQIGNMMVPQAPATLGPQVDRDGWFYCYQHSPAGALLAAIGVWAAGTGATSSDVAHHLAVKPTRQAMSATKLPGGLRLAGYQFLSYTPDTATVEVFLDVYNQGEIEGNTPMIWIAATRDWRLQLPDSGSLSGGPVDGCFAGCVPWQQP